MKLQHKILVAFALTLLLLVSVELILTELCIATGKVYEANPFSLALMAQYGRSVEYLLYFAFNSAVLAGFLLLYAFFHKFCVSEFSDIRYHDFFAVAIISPLFLIANGMLLFNVLNNLTVFLQVI